MHTVTMINNNLLTKILLLCNIKTTYKLLITPSFSKKIKKLLRVVSVFKLFWFYSLLIIYWWTRTLDTYSLLHILYYSFVKDLNQLKLGEEGVSKVVPERIFSLAIHPAHDRTLVMAGDKWGKLGFWDVVGGPFIYQGHLYPSLSVVEELVSILTTYFPSKEWQV